MTIRIRQVSHRFQTPKYNSENSIRHHSYIKIKLNII